MSEPEHKPFDARGYAADKIRAEQLELLIDQSYPAAYMSLVVAGLLVMILWPAQDHRTLLFWLGAAAPLPMPGGELVVTASLGVTEGNSGVGELMQQADTALYLAKANGRYRVEPYQQAEVEPEEQNAVTG